MVQLLQTIGTALTGSARKVGEVGMRLIDADMLTDWIITELRKVLCHKTGCFDKLNGRAAANLIGKRIDDAPTVNEWHPYNPMGADRDGLKDHHYYLVAVKGKETAMKAKYHIDSPFGFEPVNGEFDPMDVTHWMPLPELPQENE